jgi:alginate O-acetyltransferase complex protein AlgJ
MAVQLTEREQWWRSLLLAAAVLAILLGMFFPGRLIAQPQFNEKRVLAAWPAWPTKSEEWRALPKAVDAWVQDHFPARTRLITGLNWLRYKAGDSGVRSVIVGRHGWLFHDNGSHLGMGRTLSPLTDQEAAVWVAALEKRTKETADAGAEFFVLVPPVKDRVYPEHAPAWYADQGLATDAYRLLDGARDVGLENVLYLLPEMQRVRIENPPAYTPFDTHWTGFGAYAGYRVLAQRLRETDSPIEEWPISRYQRLVTSQVPRDTALMLGIAGFVRPSFPQFEHSETVRRLKTTYLTDRRDWTGARVMEAGNSDGPTLLMTGDSFSNEILPFLLPHFSRIIFAHHQDGFFRDDLLAQFNPDVVVIEVFEPGVRHSMSEKRTKPPKVD